MTSRAAAPSTPRRCAPTPHDLILAEGIFAAEIIADLRGRGLLAGAYCVHHHRVVTFVWRLLRDLSEHRKPPWTLVRRGLALMRDEPQVVARQESLGAVSARAKDLEPLLSALRPLTRSSLRAISWLRAQQAPRLG